VTEPIGPNVKKLIAQKMALLMIPEGTTEPLKAGATAILTPGSMGQHARVVTTWVREALAAIKAAPDNPYGDDDEAIARELLRKIDERKGVKGDL
jgi:hypothetical protein